jgi:glutathione S-transferase
MTYKLYARTSAGSAAVEALLAVANLPHSIVDVPREADGSIPSWFRAINSRGEVPALAMPDGSLMTESAAMMIYLADVASHTGLAPGITSPLRPSYLRWMVYLATAPYTTDLRLYYPERYSTDVSHAPQIKTKAESDYARDMDYLAASLGKGPFILGDRISAADIYAAMLMSWAPDFGALMKRQPRLREIYDAVSANAAIRKVWDRNDMP